MTGAELRRIREALGLTQAEMADVIGLRGGKTSVYRMEAGLRKISGTVARLAQIVDTRMDARQK